MGNVIGLSGEMASGKDVVASWLAKNMGYKILPFSSPMKQFCAEVFGKVNNKKLAEEVFTSLYGPSEFRNKDIVYTCWEEAQSNLLLNAKPFIASLGLSSNPNANVALVDWYVSLFEKKTLNIRNTLQLLGTEWGRKLDDNVWIRYAYLTAETSPYEYVIPDHRFKNEIDYTKRKGKVYRVIRPYRKDNSLSDFKEHASEKEQLDVKDKDFTGVLALPEGLEYVEEYLEKYFGRSSNN